MCNKIHFSTLYPTSWDKRGSISCKYFTPLSVCQVQNVFCVLITYYLNVSLTCGIPVEGILVLLWWVERRRHQSLMLSSIVLPNRIVEDLLHCLVEHFLPFLVWVKMLSLQLCRSPYPKEQYLHPPSPQIHMMGILALLEELNSLWGSFLHCLAHFFVLFAFHLWLHYSKVHVFL